MAVTQLQSDQGFDALEVWGETGEDKIDVQNFTPSPTARRAQACSGVRAQKHQPSRQVYLLTAHFGGFERHVHLATPRRTASTVAKRVVTQIMFRRFEVTTGKNPDRSVAFNGLAFLRRLLCCRIAGFVCAMVIPVSEGPQALGAPEPLIAFPGGSWCPCSSKIADATDEALNSVG
jgi:hypothetical protein